MRFPLQCRDPAILNGATSSLLNRVHNTTVVEVVILFLLKIVLLSDFPQGLEIKLGGLPSLGNV
jgi:hypothetical protein